MKSFYLRALGISAVKIVLLTGVTIADVVLIASYLPVKVHALGMTIVVFLVTFLFGEWLFLDPRGIDARRFSIVAGVTFLWEAFLSLLALGALMGDMRVFLNIDLRGQLIVLILHVLALGAALFDRRRLTKMRRGPGGIEGLAS